MSANTETTGAPPKGYVECPKKCGRWTFRSMEPPQDECWTCIDPTGKQNAIANSKDWTPPIAAPAQEAPKAEQLPFSFTDDEGRVHRFATGAERDNASRAYGAWMKAQTGTPYAGPERLPRPQLAADWVEDCLPRGDR